MRIHFFNRSNRLCVSLLLIGLSLSVSAQNVTQTIRGIVVDNISKVPIVGATVVLPNTSPLMGTITDTQGKFQIDHVPLGRHDISASYIGYSTFIQTEVLVNAAEETLLEIGLSENNTILGEVVITSDQRKVTNEAALVSSKSFQVEELVRIPGGVDDPARMIRKFPGVTPSAYPTTNHINIRGNASRAVRWRLDDMDIYNPNHFGFVGGSGGSLTIFSQRLLTSTDFFSGAFPADYGNALGGVFDVRFRNGNNERRQHSIQMSIIGIDIATEGPFSKKNNNSSYIANYRYSSTGLIEPILDLGALPLFQDLSFKLHFKTKSGGSLNIFGIGGISNTTLTPVKDTIKWKEPGITSYGYFSNAITGTLGANYILPFNKNTFLKSSIIGTGLKSDFRGYFLNKDLISADTSYASNDRDYKLSWQTYVNHRFGPKHTHRTGIILNGLHTNVYYGEPDRFDPNSGTAISDTARFGTGTSALIQAFSRSQFYINEHWQCNVGVHAMYFRLTNEISIEPRLGIRYRINEKSSISFGYGLHSQMEPFYTHISQQWDEESKQNVRLNEQLKFNKAHHLTLGFYHNFNERWKFASEIYYQYLFNMVVARDYPISRIGGYSRRFETLPLNNGGKGENYGLELVVERSFKDGLFFMANTSIFESNYSGNDGIKRPSQFNSKFVFNIVGGKEWQLGKRKGKSNFLNVNLSATYSGPQYYTPLDLETSLKYNRIHNDINNPNSAKQEALLFIDASIIFKINGKRSNSQIALQVSNLLNKRAITRRTIDLESKTEAFLYGDGILPVLGWRINF